MDFLDFRLVETDEDDRDWGPRMVKLESPNLETPLYYSTRGDNFYGKRWYRVSKTPPKEFEEALALFGDDHCTLSYAKEDLGETIFQIKAYYDNLNDFDDLQLENERAPSEWWVNELPLELEEYEYFYAIVYLK